VRFPRIPVAQQIAFTLRVPYRWLAYDEGIFEVYPYDYPIEDFWTTVKDRLAYLLWTSGTKQLTFDKEFSTGEMWIIEARQIADHWIPILNEKFKCPGTFIKEGLTICFDSLDFYLNEFTRGLKID
jgi:hypothetical protein